LTFAKSIDDRVAFMKIQIASITEQARTRDGECYSALAEVYLGRLPQYSPVEARVYRSEGALLEALAKLRGRTAPVVVLLDSRGKAFTSEEFAGWVGRQRDGGVQNLIFAVGPADGWTDAARSQAGLLLSLGKMTLPHELARVVLVEQVYRAFTILAGHPYHRV
jgi:23S rRNA (pseudouridine1915-N3)-methyltransferase